MRDPEGSRRVSAPEAIGFLLVPRFSMLAFLSAVEPLRIANRLAGRDLYAWQAYSADGGPVEASNGMRLVVQGPVETADTCGTLFVCAGFEPERYAEAAILRTLRGLARAGLLLGALDTGAVLLAKAGLLDGIPVTMHWEAVPAFRETFPRIQVVDALYRIEGNRITCAGGTAAMDMMLDRIAAQHGAGLAIAVSEQLIHDRIRKREDGQRMERGAAGIVVPRLAKVIGLMERHLDEPVSKAKLATRCGLSVRQFERLFRQHMGEAPAAHYLALRLTRARHLLRQTDMSVTDVAAATGFSAASTLARAYRRHFALAPRDDRREPTRWAVPLTVS